MHTEKHTHTYIGKLNGTRVTQLIHEGRMVHFDERLEKNKKKKVTDIFI